MADLLPRLGARRAEATVILSGRFVRYAIVPWSDELASRAEELAFARHCFAATYGVQADQWDLRLSPGPPGRARLASAVDRGLVEALRAIVAKAGHRLRSVQPGLMAAYNRWRSQADSDCLFLLAENNFYTCASVRRGDWLGARSAMFAGAIGEQLPFILERELLWSGAAERPCVLAAVPEESDLERARSRGWKVTMLRAPAGAAAVAAKASHYAMEMCA
jgi:hypothetical protein